MKVRPPFLSFRKQIQDFARSCEHLIADAIDKPLTDEELQLVDYYASELRELVLAAQKQKLSLPAQLPHSDQPPGKTGQRSRNTPHRSITTNLWTDH